MITALVYILSVIVLAICANLSRKALFHLSYLFFSFKKIGIIIYSLLYLPGTIIHELSHFFTAAFLGVRTGDISIFPKKGSGDHIQLGSVQVAKTDFFRSSLIGVAPFIVGNILLLYLVAQVPIDFSAIKLSGILYQLGAQVKNVQFWLVIYSILTISNTLFTSKEDRRHWPVLIILIIILTSALSLLDISISFPKNIEVGIKNQFQKISIAFWMASILNIFMYVLLKTLQHITQKIIGKRVVSAR